MLRVLFAFKRPNGAEELIAIDKCERVTADQINTVFHIIGDGNKVTLMPIPNNSITYTEIRYDR